jgi:tRNA-dihydrouridine synthase
MLVGSVGEEHAAREMRKHVAWYIKGLPHSARVREQVNRTRTATELTALLRDYLGELAAQGLEAFAPDPAAHPVETPRAAG